MSSAILYSDSPFWASWLPKVWRKSRHDQVRPCDLLISRSSCEKLSGSQRLPAGRGKEPRFWPLRRIGRENLVQRRADRHDPIPLGLRLPVFFVDDLGTDIDQPLVQIDVIDRQPQGLLAAEAGVDERRHQCFQRGRILKDMKLLIDLSHVQEAYVGSRLPPALDHRGRVGTPPVGRYEAPVLVAYSNMR